MKRQVLQALQGHPKVLAAMRRLRGALRGRATPAYSPIGQATADEKILRAWQQESLPQQQAAIVDRELEALRAGRPPLVFSVLANALRERVRPDGGTTLLEVGCSGGHYHDVLKLLHVPHQYTGCDISSAFIAAARLRHPQLPFLVADATALPWPDQSFDIVVSGCCLLHIPDYALAVAEAARVARDWVVFHRTPVLHASPTQEFLKEAYGVRMLEIHFNEAELISLFARHGLRVTATDIVHQERRGGDSFAVKTYTCSKEVS